MIRKDKLVKEKDTMLPMNKNSSFDARLSHVFNLLLRLLDVQHLFMSSSPVFEKIVFSSLVVMCCCNVLKSNNE